MPRQLLRDGRIVTDDWRYLTEIEAADADEPTDVATPTPAEGTATTRRAANLTPASTEVGGNPGLLIALARWLNERDHWAAHQGRLGVVLLPADKVELLSPDLGRFDLVAAEFPGPSDGRGYTQGRLLRERHGFRGELRAAGYVRRDQLFFLARCGFNSFELPESDLATAVTAFSTFSAEYQPSNDEGLGGRRLQHR